MPEFLATEHATGPVAVIELAGRLDGSASARMEQLHAVFDESPDAVLLDFGDVDYINSTGIALIVGLAAKARATGVPLQVCGLTDHYAHIFQITRLADFVSMHPDRAAALAAGEAQPTG